MKRIFLALCLAFTLTANAEKVIVFDFEAVMIQPDKKENIDPFQFFRVEQVVEDLMACFK